MGGGGGVWLVPLGKLAQVPDSDEEVMDYTGKTPSQYATIIAEPYAQQSDVTWLRPKP